MTGIHRRLQRTFPRNRRGACCAFRRRITRLRPSLQAEPGDKRGTYVSSVLLDKSNLENTYTPHKRKLKRPRCRQRGEFENKRLRFCGNNLERLRLWETVAMQNASGPPLEKDAASITCSIRIRRWGELAEEEAVVALRPATRLDVLGVASAILQKWGRRDARRQSRWSAAVTAVDL